MARRRGQRKGYLREESGSWLLTWREDVRDDDGKLIRKPFTKKIAIAKGSGSVSKREAQRIAWEDVLSKLDTVSLQPSSLMVVSDFIEKHFIPDVVYNLKRAGQLHYASMFKHVIPAIGSLRLREVVLDDVQKLVRQKLDSGLSTQTVRHIKNVISAVFKHAKRKQWYSGENPAVGVRMPEMKLVRLRRALSFEQARLVLPALSLTVRTMALLSMTTSMNVAELCGLKWKRVNLTAQWIIADGEPVPPMSIAVRENYYAGVFDTVKARKRNRNVPMPASVAEALAMLKSGSKFVLPDDVVFASRTGTPVDQHNISNRELKRVGEGLSIPLNWHTFRRTFATLSNEIGMDRTDRQALMGHAAASMTDYYTIVSVERMRAGADKIALELASSDKLVTSRPC